MAKFKLKKPKAPKRANKSPKAYADAYEKYIVRLKEYNRKKAAHEKAQQSKPKNSQLARIQKLKAQAAKIR